MSYEPYGYLVIFMKKNRKNCGFFGKEGHFRKISGLLWESFLNPVAGRPTRRTLAKFRVNTQIAGLPRRFSSSRRISCAFCSVILYVAIIAMAIAEVTIEIPTSKTLKRKSVFTG
jgi:hypothetical protein